MVDAHHSLEWRTGFGFKDTHVAKELPQRASGAQRKGKGVRALELIS
jgi:hypothetical protein